MATATRTLSTRQQTKQKPKVDYKEVARATIKEFSQDDCTGLAAESAYHILFSIFPLAIFGASMSAIINSIFGLDLFGKIMSALTSVLPADARSTIAAPLASVLTNKSGGLLSVGIILALWSGSNAMSTFIKALNRAYDVEETRPIWKAKGLQVFLTLFMGVLMVVAFILIAFGGKIIGSIADHIGAGSIFKIAWSIARWPMVIVFISLALAVLYWTGPNIKQKFQWISPGATIATLVWVIAIYVFGFYVSKFGNYDKTYGVIGGVMVLLLVFYLSSLVVILGAELNAELAKRYDPETIEDIAAHPEKDKGETIYADKAPKKSQPDRESDLKGAEVRGEPITNRTAPTAKSASGKQRMVNFSTGKREDPSPHPDARYTMTATPTMTRRNGMTGPAEPPTKRAVVGVGLLGLSAVGMAAKRLLKK
ncbi:MAG: YihY/virulence factor BrkB family protein [Chloroflexota bacterium]|nr:YihY/virulence factor BrkB family protein [Chloroflexota bacterium]